MPIRLLRLPAALTMLAAVLPAPAAGAAVIEVTRADDPAPDTCLPTDCSLREAAFAAVATPESDLIVLQAGQYLLSRGSLPLTGPVEVRGAGADQTRVVGSDDDPLLRILDFGDIALVGMEVVNTDGQAVAAVGGASVLLRDVSVPFGGGWVGPGSQIAATIHLRIENSAIGDVVNCAQSGGSCRIFDSEVGTVFVQGADTGLELVRSIVGPADGIAYGIGIASEAPAVIRDSVVRNALWPLLMTAVSQASAPTVVVERTRFLGNHGPVAGDRPGIVSMEEVEFRGHVTSTQIGDATRPSVLLAGPGPLWRLSRALIVGNRGGGTDGSAIRILSGGRVGILNATVDDNTFRGDVQNGYGHAIGLYTGSATPALLTIVHTTLRRATSLAAGATGSLLTVRGPNATVTALNSLFRGTCAFGGGGSVANALGSIESPGASCQFDPAQNGSVPEIQLHMGTLADHGGFTHSYHPSVGSALLDAANGPGCVLAGLDQRRYLRDPDGAGCDVGSVEAGSLSDVLFADGFE